MNTYIFALIAFMLFFCSALLGFKINKTLPPELFSEDNKNFIYNVRSAIIMLSALALSMLIVSGKSAHESKFRDIRNQSSKAIFLDHILIDIGKDATDARRALSKFLELEISELKIASIVEKPGSPRITKNGHSMELFDHIDKIVATDETKSILKKQAQLLALELYQIKTQILEELGSNLIWPLVYLLMFWMTIVCFSFCLLMDPSFIHLLGMFVLSLCLMAAFYLIVELDLPLQGAIHVSYSPLELALEQINSR